MFPDLKRLPRSFGAQVILALHIFVAIPIHPQAGGVAVEPPAIVAVQGGAEYLGASVRAVRPNIYVVMDVLKDVVGIVDVDDIALPVLDCRLP